jgi:hypothetical protein
MKSTGDARKPAVLVKKRRNGKAAGVDGSNRKVTPNEGRRVTSQPGPAVSNGWDDDDATSASGSKSRRRSSDATSVATLEVAMPKITSLTSGISAACEMALVPFEASRMWLRNHPRVGNGGSSVVHRGLDMLTVILGTTEACWHIAFVYSKTGKLRLPKITMKRKSSSSKDGWGEDQAEDGLDVQQMTPAQFVWDCMRSFVYVLIFLALLVLLVRIVRWVLGVVKMVALVVRWVGWITRVLLGGGILW